MSKVVCYFHSADADGHCSGAIVRKRFPHAQLIGWNYGGPVPMDYIDADTDVYLVDITFSLMEEIQRKCKTLTIIDHHQTAKERIEDNWGGSALPSNVHVNVEIGKAACQLVWEYFYETTMPAAVYLIGVWDVWAWHNVPGAEEFRYGLEMQDTWPSNVVLWDSLLNPYPDPFVGVFPPPVKSIMNEGASILKYKRRHEEKYIKATGFVVEFEGLRALVSNAQMTGSTLFDTMYNPNQHDIMMVFGWRGGCWNFTLFSAKDGVNVGDIAKRYGGGGHAGAAGFRVASLPFELPAKERSQSNG